MHSEDRSGEKVRAPWHRDPHPRADYEVEQAVILGGLLEEYPELVTWDEARIARVRDRENWSESDAFEIAINALFAGGLIRRQGDFLVPIRPIRLMAELGFELG